MSLITFLGPQGTFTQQAVSLFVRRLGMPLCDQTQFEHNLVPKNEDVVPGLIENGGYAVLAMETLAQGRVTPSFESLMLPRGQPRFGIIMGLKVPITFCLMARKGLLVDKLKGVISHAKSFGACQSFAVERKKRGCELEEVSSNGEAARLVAQDDRYEDWAVLGPAIAAEMYGLDVIGAACEDRDAVTTFYLLGPDAHAREMGPMNRAVVCFNSNELLKGLSHCGACFSAKHLKGTRIHSRDGPEAGHQFLLELNVPREKELDFGRALSNLRANRDIFDIRCLGPFAVEQAHIDT